MIIKLNSENFSRIIRELIIERATFSLRSAEEGIVTIDVDKSSSGLTSATNVKNLPIDLTEDLQCINAAIHTRQSLGTRKLTMSTTHLGPQARIQLIDVLEKHKYSVATDKYDSSNIIITW